MEAQLLKGIQPFWFWNGKMDHEEIIRQIDEMADKGIQGFLIHPRQGMELPYLTEEYFKRVETAVAQAKKHGMEVWLYDEYPYPSGVSGGQVMLDHPEYCCKALKKTVGTVSAPDTLRLYAPWGEVLSARAYPVVEGVCDFTQYVDLMEYVGTGYSEEIFQLSGLTAYNRKRFFTGNASKLLCWTPPEGEWRVYLFVEEVMKHFKYFENFVDPLNPAAIRYFLETTHEKYKKYIGREFGKTVKGVFTDEVTAFPPSQPWSPLLPELIEKRYGRNIIDVLPALTEDMGPQTQRIRFEYMDTATEAFIDSYDKQVYDWCEANGLMYIGEKPILRSKELEYVHVPGTDAGHAKVGAAADPLTGKYRANGKIISSAAHFYNKPAALCEAFHSIGWGMTVQDMKWIFDWLAMSGVDWYVQHAFFYTTDGLKKHDAPPSSFYQMPWWKEQKNLSRYAIGLGKLLGGMKRHISTLLVDPATSGWVLEREGKKAQEEAISAVMNALMHSGCDFYVIDPQLLAEGQVLEQAGNVVLKVKGECYDRIVLPNMNNIEDCAYRKLREYAERGGLLVAAGTLPLYNIQQEAVAEWFAEAFSGKQDNLIQTDVASVGQVLAAQRADLWTYDQVPAGVYVVAGQSEQGAEQLFVINTTADPVEVQVSADLAGGICQMDLRDMSRRRMGEFAGQLKIQLEPWASAVYEIAVQAQEAPTAIQTVELPFEATDWGIRRHMDNALYLGRWQLTLPDGQQGITGSYPIIDQMEELAMKMPVKTVPYFGCPKELAFQPVEACFETRFQWEAAPQTDAWLVMEPETLKGDWTLQLNGHELTEADFQVHPFYLLTNLAANIKDYVQPGQNEVKVKIHCTKSWDGLRNPLYIFGDFGVEAGAKGQSAVAPKMTGAFGQTVSVGLPFYAGDVSYTHEVILEQAPTGEICVKLDAPHMQDTLRLWVNGVDCGVCQWTPRELIVPAGVFKAGSNQIELVVSGTLAGLFEGQYFDQEQHKYVQIEDEAQDVTRERSFTAW